IRGSLEFIHTLQPDLRSVFVVSGAGRSDRQRESVARQELGQYHGKVTLTYVAGLSLEDLELRLRNLPQQSAVFFLSMFEDAAGKRLVTTDIYNQVAHTANAPVYTLSGARIGSGIVASLLMDQETMAQETAEILIRLLQGESIKNVPMRGSRGGAIVDW